MALIEWQSSYSVDVKEIDDQHKRLVEMINNLHQAMADRKAKEVLGDIIQGLVDYTQTHFSTEEKYFKQFGYEDTEEHIKQHENFVKKVSDFKEGFDSGRLMLSIDVINFLKDWLINHINGTDQKYTDFMHNNGIQ